MCVYARKASERSHFSLRGFAAQNTTLLQKPCAGNHSSPLVPYMYECVCVCDKSFRKSAVAALTELNDVCGSSVRNLEKR